MGINIRILAFLFVLIFKSSLAQFENIPLVTVFGESAIKVKPDQVILGIKVNKEIKISPSSNAAIFEIFKTEDTKIRLFGFDDKNISESLIQIDHTVYVKEVFITINDLNNLDKYLLELNKLGFKEFIFVDYRVRDLTAYKNLANKEAMVSAKFKAGSLANELGQAIGKVHKIEELDYEDYNWYTIHNTPYLENITSKSGADNCLVEPGYIVFTSKIKVSFDLLK